MKKSYTFIDLFAGIGGFHTAMHSVGAHCVFASEWDKYARISYEANYKDIEPNLFKKDSLGNYKYFNEDITKANPADIPDFDVLDFYANVEQIEDKKAYYVGSQIYGVYRVGVGISTNIRPTIKNAIKMQSKYIQIL